MRGNKWVVGDGEPGGEARFVFAAVDHAIGIGGVVGGVALLLIVVANDVELGIIEVRFNRRARGRDGARGVERLHIAAEPRGDGREVGGVARIGVVGIVDLVADGPHDNRRMIAVAQDHVLNVAVGPLVKIGMVAGGAEARAVPVVHPFPFAVGPFVERLVHDEKAELVAKVEEFGGGRIVAAPNGVGAGLLENSQAAFPDLTRDGRAESAGVFVEADALELHGLAVEPEAGVGVELDGADAEGSAIGVERVAVPCDLGDGGVERGMIDGP